MAKLPLSGVHSIMMEKSAQGVGGGGVHAHPLSLFFTITYKVAVDAPADRADTFHPISSLPPVQLPYALVDFIPQSGTMSLATVHILSHGRGGGG